MQQVSLVKVQVNFECEHCGVQKQVNITEAVSEGAPVCCNGDEMDMVDCEIDSQMVFG